MDITLVVLIPVGLVLIGGAFALIYWWLGRGGDDGPKS